MNRRGFLQLLSTGALGAATLDWEHMLWVPGQKTIFLPPANAIVEDAVFVALHTAMPAGASTEATYRNYARVAIPATTRRVGWRREPPSLVEPTQIDFPECNGGSSTITHFDLLDGNGRSLISGPLLQSVHMMSGASMRLKVSVTTT